MSLVDGKLSIAGEARVEFGVGALATLPALLADAGHRRAFVVTDQGLRATGVLTRVLRVLASAGIEYDCYEGVTPNPSTSLVAEGAVAAREFGVAAVVAVGGGSALDAAKAIALGSALPGSVVIAVPTTSGTGAETNGFGVIEDLSRRCKVYVGDERVRPRAVVLDPELTIGLPPRITAATGVDALVHGIESLSSRRANPLSVAYATQAVTMVARWLPVAAADGTDLEARGQLLLGAHLAGRALTLSGLGLVHGFAHAITATLGTPHGVALAAVLEPVMRYSAVVAQGAYAQVARAMETADAIEGAAELVAAVGLRTRLADLGADRAQLAGIAAGALADAVTANTPLLPSEAEAVDLLVAAF
ncbi:iron-containing alcohol dehydrogenase family protein [Amycolatopsis sp. H20-H5]|uniref:iron-containing alcohol dehydrogenase family protein n=1 Tax=Amycolatopsis sp. H20-H5 TaxID=3046309 RepID=UPI002DB79048|nr:iron-containing alcohol dehydrogenase [Amycolatopsis sp. H20-H5]MEC3975446.1 iron-containing alcohol dehydrogenase [Amycolatopsis sp. H20-H5]